MSNIYKICNVLGNFVQNFEESFQQDGLLGTNHAKGVGSGYSEIDSIIGGFAPGELAILGGAPSVGKTSLLLNIAENIAMISKKGVLILSSESKPEYLVMRHITSLGRINSNKIRTTTLCDDDWPRITTAVDNLARAPIYYGVIPYFVIEEVNSCIEEACETYNLSTVVIDTLQSIRVNNGSDCKAVELANAARELKSLALNYDLLVITCSHLNGNLYQRPNKRPVMSDLPGDGSVEHEADYVIFIHREEMFTFEEQNPLNAEIIIAKNRCGPTGTVELSYMPQFLRFDGIGN